LYNEEENLAVLHKRLADLAESNPDFLWEFILVDDGSTDHSFEVLKRLVEQNNRIRALRFSRNFGTGRSWPGCRKPQAMWRSTSPLTFKIRLS
jgi:glycosyltransferase involved in cell wall biosynthesis